MKFYRRQQSNLIYEPDDSIHSTCEGPVVKGIESKRHNNHKPGIKNSVRRSIEKLSIPKNLSFKSISSFKSVESSLSTNSPKDEETIGYELDKCSVNSTESTSKENSNDQYRFHSRMMQHEKTKNRLRKFGHSQGNISYGVSQMVGKKDQDRFDIRLGKPNTSDIHFFGVYDGHGTSDLAANLCVEKLYEDIYTEEMNDNDYDKEGYNFENDKDFTIDELPSYSYQLSMPMPNDHAITQGYMKTDNRVQENRSIYPRTGSCAINLLLNQKSTKSSKGEVKGKVSWAGDCRAILITGNNEILKLSLDHRIDENPAEYERICNSDHTPRKGLLESELWKRETEKAAQAGTADTPRLRAHSFVERRTANGQPVGPNCVFSHTGGVSLQVTRSIGDAYAARSIISQPDICHFSIPEDEYSRFILGSDGLFECISIEEIAKFVSKIQNPEKAASKLANVASNKRLYSGMSTDDITIMIIDVNPEKRIPKKFKSIGKVTSIV